MGGEHDDFGGWKRFENLPRGFQTIELRHGNVHDDHGGTQFFRQLHRLAASLRFADNFNIAFASQQPSKSFPDDQVVFGQQNSDSFHRHSNFSSAGLVPRLAGSLMITEWNPHF